MAIVSRLRRFLPRLLLCFLLASSVTMLASCGDDEVIAERPKDPRKNRPKKTKAGLDPAGMVNVNITNPRWDILKDHFQKMATKRHTPVHDVFKPQVLNFIPRPELPEPETTEVVADVEAEVEEVRGPLQLYPLTDYELLLVMSGTAVPKALVVDPKGEAHAVTREMRLGDGGGIVEHISQYMVVVREPNSERPYRLSIKPPFMDMTTKLADSGETADASSTDGGGDDAP